MALFLLQGTAWMHVPSDQPFQSITVGGSYRVWAIARDGSAFYRNGITDCNRTGIYFFFFSFFFASDYTGWPRKNATLTINNFKKTRDRMKKVYALLRIKFFSQVDDTKIVNFEEGVLIQWPFLWSNVIFKICPSISKVTIYIPKFFHCLSTPGKVSALAL